MGDFAQARPHFERVIPLYQPGAPNVTDLRYSQDHAVWSLSSLAFVLWPLGYPEQAATAAAKSLSWTHAMQHAMTTGFALWTGSTSCRAGRERDPTFGQTLVLKTPIRHMILQPGILSSPAVLLVLSFPVTQRLPSGSACR
jgi:hypothetical protein